MNPLSQVPQLQPNDPQSLKMEVFKERLKKREIWINGPIDDSLVERLYTNLIDLEAQSNEMPISVVINSNGGNFYESLVATDIMGTINCQVKTVALANAVSGGFIIFMGGNMRIIHDHSCLMMHSAAVGVADKIPDIQERMDYVNAAQEKMAKFFAIQTGGKTTKEYWMSLFRSGKDKWFSVEEAIALGIAHKVVRRLDMVDPQLNVRPPYTWDVGDIAKSQLSNF